MSDRQRVVAWVSGEVQGVGYRAFVVREANVRNVAGSAVNLLDGRVQVVAEGPAAEVRALVDALSGPRAPGRVTDVATQSESPRGVTGFTVG